MKIRNISEKEYNNFIKGYKDSLFFQSVEWGNFKAKTNWDMELIGYGDSKKIYAVAMLLSQNVPVIRKKLYYCPRGFILDYSNLDLLEKFTSELRKYLKQKKALFLKINPYIIYQDRDKDGNIIGKNEDELIEFLKKLGYKHYGFYKNFEDKKDLEPRWLSVLDLEDKSVDELLKNMNSTTRWLINKSQKNCISIEDATYDELIEYKKLMNHTSERRNFQDRPLSYYQTMYKELSKNNMIRILFGKIDLKQLKTTLSNDKKHLEERVKNIENNSKKSSQVQEYNSQISSLENRIIEIDELINSYGLNPIIATGVYLEYGDQIVYLFGGSYKEFMKYGAQYLMQYEMIKYAKDKKYKKLNFYGIDGNFEKNSKYYGLFDFKRGFNANVVELVGEFDLVINKFNYILYNIMFKTYKLFKKIKLFIRK